MAKRAPSIAAVVIGRNEGARLQRCLRSLAPEEVPTVYVDSGSTDGSQDFAREIGARVHELATDRPFTAARARAEGFAAILAAMAPPDYVMFVDGDCEIEPGWLDEAVRFLDAEPGYAVACGRRRERHPEASFYNRLMDLEWDTPVGSTDACGGDAVFRVSAYRQAGGYDPEMIAHEEPELSSRIRTCGWRLARIAAPMTIHDADIKHLWPYLMRSVRAGYGYAQSLSRAKSKLSTNEVQLVRRALQWPALAGAALIAGLVRPSLGVIMISPVALSLFRDSWRSPTGISPIRFALVRLASKFAEFVGILRWVRDRMLRRKSGAVLYK